jgi:hypothetical protein
MSGAPCDMKRLGWAMMIPHFFKFGSNRVLVLLDLHNGDGVFANQLPKNANEECKNAHGSWMDGLIFFIFFRRLLTATI